MFLDVSIRERGPLFDGRSLRVLNAYTRHVEQEIADTGRTILIGELGRVLKTQTPYYVTRIKVEDGRRITDSGVIYGPWLAGVGSRNFPATKFRGYDHWPATRDLLNTRKQGIGERLLRRYIGRM